MRSNPGLVELGVRNWYFCPKLYLNQNIDADKLTSEIFVKNIKIKTLLLEVI